MSQVGAPVVIKVRDPKNDDGEVLNNTNATAQVTILSPAGVVLTVAAMTWDAVYLRFEFLWDTTGLVAGLYRARVDVTPTAGLPTPHFIEIELQAPPGDDRSPRVGPCETWPFVRCSDTVHENEDILASAATHILWALSGHRYGLCDMVLRPCARRAPWEPYLWLPPAVFSTIWSSGLIGPSSWGPWGAWPGCSCSRGPLPCSCTQLSTVRLPGPIAELVQVRVDGVDLNLTTAVRVDRFRQISRIDGGEFPVCQDFTKEDGPGTFITRHRRGRRVPALGQLAMGELVDELGKSCKGQPCGLSARAKEVTRKGVTEAQFDPQIFLDKGRTGLPKCDLFIGTVNPHGLRRQSRVFRADAV